MAYVSALIFGEAVRCSDGGGVGQLAGGVGVVPGEAGAAAGADADDHVEDPVGGLKFLEIFKEYTED
jgi:hypothetical protein